MRYRFAPYNRPHRGPAPVPLDGAGAALRASYLRWRAGNGCPCCGADAGRPCLLGCLVPTQWHARHRLVLALSDAGAELAGRGHVCWVDDTTCGQCGRGFSLCD
jgi:hypothetical protein